jgi:hypothetical protein
MSMWDLPSSGRWQSAFEDALLQLPFPDSPGDIPSRLQRSHTEAHRNEVTLSLGFPAALAS